MAIRVLQNLKLVDAKKNIIHSCNLLISDNKILKVIPEKSFTARTKKYFQHNFPDFKVLDLKGGYVIPGFTDAHTHFLAYGIGKQRIDLSDCQSLDECLQKLNANKTGDIIFGVDWDESIWKNGDKQQLDKQSLDRISKTKPVIMRRICGHFAVCNTKALEYIKKNWRIVDRKKGLLYEDAALYLNRIFKPDMKTYEAGFERAMSEALSLGITSIHEITDLNGFEVYQLLRKKLKLRIALYLQTSIDNVVNAGLHSNLGDDFLKFAGVKIFMDGAVGALTAALKKPYLNSINYGKLLLSCNELGRIIKKAESHSVQLMIHSIGDRATETVLRAFHVSGIRKNTLRHRIEHLEILNDEQIRKIAKLGIIASMQPNFLRWQVPGNMYERNLGTRYREMNCFNKLKKAGIRLIFGSDCMPPGPLYGITLAIKSPFFSTLLTPAEALRFYTETAGYVSFDEDKKGSIEAGRFADFVILTNNPLNQKNYDNLHISAVFVNGEVVYRADKNKSDS